MFPGPLPAASAARKPKLHYSVLLRINITIANTGNASKLQFRTVQFTGHPDGAFASSPFASAQPNQYKCVHQCQTETSTSALPK